MRPTTANTTNERAKSPPHKGFGRPRECLLLELLIDEPIFIGFKASNALRQVFNTLGIADKKYVSSDDSTFLRLCWVGEDLYVGKLIDEPLSTDQVDDNRRNILSILRKLGPVVPLPTTLRIFACRTAGDQYVTTKDELSMSRTLSEHPVVRAAR